MDEKSITPEDVQAQIAAALKAERDANEAAIKAAEDFDAAVEAKTAEKIEALKAEMVKGRRLPDFDGVAPYQTQYAGTGKYDHYSAGELGLAIKMLESKDSMQRPSSAAYKALALKLIEDKRDFGVNLEPHYCQSAMKAAGLSLDPSAYKADEPLYTGGTTDGGNWVHTSYGREIWANIRAQATIVSKIDSQTIPDGSKSATIPIEGTDFTWYSAPEASASDATMHIPAATVSATQITTPTNKEITVAKMGARGIYTSELVEDAILPMVAQIKDQLVKSGAEQLEHAVIDGDTQTSNVNINTAGGTVPVSTGLSRDLYLMFNGFRKLALITTPTNSRAGGTLDESDFIETMWLMGTAGLAGSDLQKCFFVVSPDVYKKSLQMSVVKTQDVWANATLQNGVLTGLWGYSLYASWFMHFKSATRKANAFGEVDQDVVANNLYGSLLGVRKDQWRFAYKRAMTIEVQRIANADAYEIVSWARVGLGYRDGEASAITYGITV